MCCDVADAWERFRNQPDELSRLINPNNVKRERATWYEHIAEPKEFLKERRRWISELPLFEKPSPVDMDELGRLLDRAYRAAGDALQ